MRISRMGSVVLFLSASIAWAGTILTTTEAAKQIGELATVCGDIASEHTATCSRGTPTFINLDKPHPNHVFTVLVWGSDRANVGSRPHTARICVTGTITEYRGTPEIVLHGAQDWYVPK